MKKTIKVFVIGIILLSCKTINIAQSNRSVFLEKWRDASYKSISDQMVIYKNDSVFIKSLINTKTSLLSSSEDHGLRKYFYDSCLKNNDKIFGNEFYILETRTRGEVMQFDFYVQSMSNPVKVYHPFH